MDNYSVRFVPVSYTHLDVYKRQHADCIKTVVKRGYKLEVDGDESKT